MFRTSLVWLRRPIGPNKRRMRLRIASAPGFIPCMALTSVADVRDEIGYDRRLIANWVGWDFEGWVDRCHAPPDPNARPEQYEVLGTRKCG